MGQYINKTSTGERLGPMFFQKREGLIADGATETTDKAFQPNLICIVDNLMFAAAAYCYSEEEFEAFKRPDGRQKVWLTHPLAEQLID
jgi:hypothetical protein